MHASLGEIPYWEGGTDDTLKIRFSAKLGEEPEVKVTPF
jgi:hypothetical protein